MKRIITSLITLLFLSFTLFADAGTRRADNLEANESFVNKEQSATPSNPVAGKQKIYFKTDGNLYKLNSTGTETRADRFTSSEESKLAGIEAGADVTDSVNVSAAGAVMNTGGTMTGDLTISGTNDTGFIIGSSGNFLATSAAPGVIAQLYRDLGATSDAPIFYIKADNPADNQPLVRLDHDGTGGGAANLQLRAPTPQIEWIETDQTTPAGKFETSLVGDFYRISGRNTGDTSFERIVEFSRLANGGRMFFNIGTGVNEFSIDGTMAGNSDDAVPTEQAVKAYTDAHSGNTANPHSVTKAQVGLTEVPNLKQNLSATVNPGVTDDSGSNYSPGSRWMNTTTDKAFVCLDASVGAAVWVETTAGAAGGSPDQNLFNTVVGDSGTNPVAETATDSLTIVGGAGLSTSGDSGTDTITIDRTLASQIEAEAGTENTKGMTPLRVAEAIQARAPPRFSNQIINGNFRLWQRGTSFTATGIYSADRWRNDFGGGSPAYTVSRQAHTVGQTDVPGEPEFFLRHDQTTASTSGSPLLRQFIENVRTLAGQEVTLSFYAKSSKAITISSRFDQEFGSGGSAAVSGTLENHNITTSWQKFSQTFTTASISGKTIGTGSSLQILFILTDNDTYQFDISQVQVEKGTFTTDFEQRPIGQELLLAQRYYWSMGSENGAVIGVAALQSSAIGFLGVFYPIEMRVVPTVTFSNSYGATWADGGGTATLSTELVGVKSGLIKVVPSSSLTSGQSLIVKMGASDSLTFDAEL